MSGRDFKDLCTKELGLLSKKKNSINKLRNNKI